MAELLEATKKITLSFFSGIRQAAATEHVTNRSLAELGASDELFETSHPELLSIIPAMRSVYASCSNVKSDDPYLVRLEDVWQHTSRCNRCKTEIASVQRRHKRIAQEPVFVE